MPLTPGIRFGPYEIGAPLGAGGMGEVYRAKDTRLGRAVAVKVLPQHLSSNPEIRARFEREAKTISTLNHPHICTLHDVGREGETDYLVMELVEGETLAQRLMKGAVPLADVLKLGAQIADAIDHAHRAGIVHRDLKPGNIMLTKSGAKLMDFGLARATGQESTNAMTRSLAMTSPVTAEGTIVGTFQYMAPEQLGGQEADARVDLWALGCVLHEMVTGKRVFEGNTLASLIAAIMGSEPAPISQLLPLAPAALDRLVGACLAKDPADRIQSAHDVKLQLSWIEAGGSQTGTAVAVALRPAHRVRWAAAAAGVLAIGALAVWYFQRSDTALQNPLEGATFTRLTDFEGAEHHAAISRDGKFVAFLSDRDGSWDVWVSQVGTGDIHNLTEGSVEELRNPTVRTIGFSPDGSLVVFWRRRPDPAGAGLVDAGWAVPTLGGPVRPYLPGISELDWSPDGSRIVYHPPTTGDPLYVTEAGEKSGHQIYSARPGVHNHFPLWSPDAAFIYFVQGFPPDEMDIWRIRPTGSEPERLTFHDAPVRFPAFLDNRTLLYLATADDGSGPWIHALDVESRVSRRISTGVEEYESLASSADGRRLVATVSGSVAGLWRVPIAGRVVHESDATRMTLPTTRGLSPRIGSGFVLYRAPKAGTDALWRVTEDTATELWNGADGRVVAGPAIAPDGRFTAFPVQSRDLTQLYVMNSDGTGARRLAEELDVRGAAAWSPDGQWIAIAAIQEGEPRLYKIPVNGGMPVRLTEEYSLDPLWSPSNRFLVYSAANVGAAFSVKAVTPEGAPHDLPELILKEGSRRMGFLASGDELVVMKGDTSSKNFWAVDLRTGRERQLTDLGPGFIVTDFDVSADGSEIIFDRAREESDIVLIDLASH